MNITEFRQQYPEYNDMSDAALAQSLYQNHYSDMPYEQFAESFGVAKQPEAVKNAGTALNDLPFPNMPQYPSGGLFPDKLAAGLDAFNTNAARLPEGILQLLNIRSPESSKAIMDHEKQVYQEASNSYPGLAMGAGIAGGITSASPLFAIPGFGPNALIRGITQGMAQSGLAGFGQYAENGDQRLANTVGSTLIGGLIPPAFRGAGYGLGKIYNTVKGNFANTAEKEIVDLGQKYKVPVFADDASQNQWVKNTGTALEEVPIIGNIPQRKAQMLAQKTAAGKLNDKYRDEMNSLEFGGATGLKNIEAIAASNSPRAPAAQALLEQAKNADDDWNKIIQTSGDIKLFRAKLIADKKYGKLSAFADQFGDVPRTNTNAALDAAIREVNDSVSPNTDLLKTLQTIKSNFNSGRLFTYTQMRAARGDIGSIISDYFKGGNALIGQKGAGSLQSLKNAIGRDMNLFAQQNGPELKTLWQNADHFYETRVAPYKDAQLAQALKTADPDTIYGKFITTGAREDGKGVGRSQRFYNALDQKGRAAVKYGIVSDAVQKAIKPDSGYFSPAQLAGNLDRVAAAKGVFFKGQDKAEIDGFKNLMRHTERSFIALNKPETGVKSIPYLITLLGGASAILAPFKTASLATGIYGVKKLFTTPWGTKFLLSASKLPVGSPAMQKVLDSALTFLKLPAGSLTMQKALDSTLATLRQSAVVSATNPYNNETNNEGEK
jgi:hypothetical protein